MPLVEFEVKIALQDNRLKKLTGEMHAKAMRICEKYAKSIKGQAQAFMDEPKHGKMYKRGSKVHIASAPGEAPARDTDALTESLRTAPYGADAWAVTVHADYGAVLEFGTIKSDRIKPRPFLKPAVEQFAKPFFEELNEKVFRE